MSYNTLKFLNRKNLNWAIGWPFHGKVVNLVDNAINEWDKQSSIPSKYLSNYHQHGSFADQSFDRSIFRLEIRSGKEPFFGVLKEQGYDGSNAGVFEIVQENGLSGLPESIACPLKYIFKGFIDIKSTYTVYMHNIIINENGKRVKYVYYGVTKRTWFERYKEHLSSSKNDPRYLFQQALNEKLNNAEYIAHCVVSTGLTKDLAYAIEEY